MRQLLRRFIYRYIATHGGWVAVPIQCWHCGHKIGDWEFRVFEGLCSHCYTVEMVR